MNVTNFNLEILIPKKPFYSYSATEPYNPCTENVDYIVFSPVEASLDIMPESLTTLQAIITSNPYSIKSGAKLFYNEKGPSMGNADGQIYIDCQPTNSSEEEVNMVVDIKAPVTYDIGTYIFLVITNPIFLLLCASAIFIILLLIIRKLITYISDDGAPSIPLLSKVK